LAIFHFGSLYAAHQLLDAGDGLARIQSFGASFGAVEDRVASIDGVMILKFLHALFRLLIAGVDHPAISLHQHRGAQILVSVPPVGWAGSRTASAQNALVHSVQFGAIFNRLVVRDLAKFLFALSLEIWLDLFVLRVEIRHVWYEIFDDVHMGQGINLGGLRGVGFDSAETGEGVGAVDVHRATAANPLPARSPESQRRVQLVLDLDQTIQHHRTASVEIDFIGLLVGLLSRNVRIPSINIEFL